MISVVICSRNNDISIQLKSNIDNTIGIDYELIVIDNSENVYSIYSAYNYGVRLSKNEICCLIHDDILFNTNNWGKIVMNYFNEYSELGVLGLVGSTIKTQMPSGYNHCPTEFKNYNILQHCSNGRLKNISLGFENTNFLEVAAIDGVFMAMNKNLLLRFDDNLEGFHGYDLNISIECHLANKKLCVTNEILIEHKSEGELNESWYRNMLILHHKYRKILPIIKECNAYYNYNEIERKNGFNFLKHALKHDLNFKTLVLFICYLKYRPTFNMKWILLKKTAQGLLRM